MQNNLIRKRAGMLFAFLALMALMIVPAMAKTKPTVAIIKAEWCSACQKLEPTMMELMKEYGGKVEFVMLDVSSDDKVAESQATAKKLGLGAFFEENKQKTSTVAVFVKGNKPQFITMQNFDREAYVKAFDQAIAKAGK
ncbi:MAG: thioredoxin domain-containing protein [Blastocatellales bacterium]